MAAKVYIVIYSLYHHIYTLALEVQKGLVAAGVDAKIFQGIIYIQTNRAMH
jgi:NAD(P)H dehydrogenase (quinone)